MNLTSEFVFAFFLNLKSAAKIKVKLLWGIGVNFIKTFRLKKNVCSFIEKKFFKKDSSLFRSVFIKKKKFFYPGRSCLVVDRCRNRGFGLAPSIPTFLKVGILWKTSASYPMPDVVMTKMVFFRHDVIKLYLLWIIRTLYGAWLWFGSPNRNENICYLSI